MSDELAWINVGLMALGTFFNYLMMLRSGNSLVMKHEVTCPNCGQPFDASRFPTVNGVRMVSCPRCWYTFVA